MRTKTPEPREAGGWRPLQPQNYNLGGANNTSLYAIFYHKSDRLVELATTGWK